MKYGDPVPPGMCLIHSGSLRGSFAGQNNRLYGGAAQGKKEVHLRAEWGCNGGLNEDAALR